MNKVFYVVIENGTKGKLHYEFLTVDGQSLWSLREAERLAADYKADNMRDAWVEKDWSLN